MQVLTAPSARRGPDRDTDIDAQLQLHESRLVLLLRHTAHAKQIAQLIDKWAQIAVSAARYLLKKKYLLTPTAFVMVQRTETLVDKIRHSNLATSPPTTDLYSYLEHHDIEFSQDFD